MKLDLGRSVTYPFEDPQWARKLIVLLILGFVPGLNLIVWCGYAVSTAHNLARGAAYPLPPWENWSDIAVRGLLSMMGAALYFSPAWMMLGCLWLASILLGARADGAFLALRCGGIILAMLFTLSMGYILWAGHLRYAQRDQFLAYLDFGGRLRDARTASSVLGTLFVYQSLLAFVLILLCVVGSMLFVLALSVAATASTVAALLALIFLAVALVGFVAIVTLAFLANGFILGTAAVAFRA